MAINVLLLSTFLVYLPSGDFGVSILRGNEWVSVYDANENGDVDLEDVAAFQREPLSAYGARHVLDEWLTMTLWLHGPDVDAAKGRLRLPGWEERIGRLFFDGKIGCWSVKTEYDFDRDGDVDLADFAHFQVIWGGLSESFARWRNTLERWRIMSGWMYGPGQDAVYKRLIERAEVVR